VRRFQLSAELQQFDLLVRDQLLPIAQAHSLTGYLLVLQLQLLLPNRLLQVRAESHNIFIGVGTTNKTIRDCLSRNSFFRIAVNHNSLHLLLHFILLLLDQRIEMMQISLVLGD
jgi:hypothetical protein